jgi:PAS domain S-box-containing protein
MHVPATSPIGAHQPDATTAEDSPSSGTTAEVSPEDPSERLSVYKLLRAGAVLIILFQLAYLGFDIFLQPALVGPAVVAMHLLAILGGCAALGYTFARTHVRMRWLHAQWRLTVFATCILVVGAMTALQLLTHQTEIFYSGLLLFIVGTGALVPWSPKWEAVFIVAVTAAFWIGSAGMMPAHPVQAYRWLGVLVAAAVAECSTVLVHDFRRQLSRQLKILRESHARLHDEIAQRERTEAKLRESEATFRRTFDAAVDAIVITRFADGALLDANPALQRLGIAHASPHGQPLGSWTDGGQREAYRRKIANEGIVRDLQVDLRKTDGTFMTAVLSGRTVELNGEKCIVTIVHDITELKEIQRELITAREAALAASQAKSEFLSSMSHEIRTPMNAILGMTELLSETPLDAQQKKYLAVMENNGNSLLGIIDDILDLARVESGRLSLENAEFDLDCILDRTLETFGMRARAKGLELTARIAPGTPTNLVGDPMRLRQILLNLVGNAIKFTDYGKVELTAESLDGDPAGLHFAVADTGIGIAPDKLDLVFSAFTQADSTMTRRYGGSGLGLAIVKRLVELMNGRVWVESEPGKGSTFHFTAHFGLRQTPEPPSPVAHGARNGVAATSSMNKLRRRLSPRILLAEDSSDNRLLIRAFLKHMPCELDEAENGEVAIRKFQTRRYDLVLMDLQMPVVDGLQAIRAIRGWERGQDLKPTPVIALTASALDEDVRRSLEAGASAHVSKPIRKAVLLDVIRKMTVGAAEKELVGSIDAHRN